MSGKHGAINPTTNDDSTSKANLMDLWKESIETSKRNQMRTLEAAKSEADSRADLEQRIRNGQAQCQTCAQRVYADESGDGGVSFQAARHISAATAGAVVTSHEHEHVAADAAESGKDGLVRQSTVGLEYCKCPECGRTYVKGGVTKTTTRPASYRKQSGGLDLEA